MKQPDVLHFYKAVKNRDQLANDRGCCRTSYAPAKAHHKQQVKRDIYKRCDHHRIQWCPAVTERTQDTGTEIVRRYHRQSCEQNTQVRHADRIDMVRRSKQIQYKTGSPFSRCGNK